MQNRTEVGKTGIVRAVTRECRGGSTITQKNNTSQEINCRISKAIQFYHQVNTLLWD